MVDRQQVGAAGFDDIVLDGAVDDGGGIGAGIARRQAAAGQ
jgi:hypothetical protein